jgi:hypothetical protein
MRLADTKFNQTFGEPLPLSDGSYALSAELYPQAEGAIAEFRRFFEDGPHPWRWDYERLRLDAARFQFPPEELRPECSAPLWVLGAAGKGSKPVWVLPRQARLEA